MPEQTEQNHPQSQRGVPRPLQVSGRFREAEVERQISSLRSYTPREILRLARQMDPGHPDFIHPETLVYLLRQYYRGGDTEAAWALAELLLQRNTRFIAQQVAAWKLPSSSQVEECLRDIQMRVFQDIMDLSQSSEFWEVRYWVCLKRRLLNIVQKYRLIADMEFHPEPLRDAEGNTTDYFDRVTNQELLTGPVRAQINEALALMSDRERTTFVLYHYEGWTQDHIADKLQVTERTVRNLLTRAERHLASWRNDSLQ